MITENALKRYKPQSTFSTVLTIWQHDIQWSIALSGNDIESIDLILDPDADLDHQHNLITFRLGQV